MTNIDSIKPAPKKTTPNNYPIASAKVSLLGGSPQKPKKRLKKILLLMLVVILILGSLVLARAVNLSNKIFVGKKTTFFGAILNLIRGGDSATLIGEDLGQVNILLLGIGGPEHDGPYLSDTMILAQVRPDTAEIALTSIPRDYLVQLPENLGDQKINAAFALGFARNKSWSQGGAWAMESVEKISGLRVPYFAVVDFSGFEKAIDQINGIDLTVEKSFTDFEYPSGDKNVNGPLCSAPQESSTSTCRYLQLHFDSGPQHMDGRRALQFTRSRHGNNNESSDFARSLRQQKVLNAFKTKILDLNLISDAGKINQLLQTFADHFHTNISPNEMFRLYTLVKEQNINQLLSTNLGLETALICPLILESNGAYVLTVCPGKSEVDIQNFFKNSFAIAKLMEEKSVVWLANSTSNRQAYNTAFRKLTSVGLTVYELNYNKDNLPLSLVYPVNQKPATVEFIVNELKATAVTVPPPQVNLPAGKVDVIVVLGQNAPIETPPVYIPPPAKKATTTTSTVPSTLPTSTPVTN